MKILITGCRGQLGTELQRQLAEEAASIGPLPERLRKATVIPVDVDELDITDREATINYIRRHQPDTVINCAAFHECGRLRDRPRCGVQGQRPRPAQSGARLREDRRPPDPCFYGLCVPRCRQRRHRPGRVRRACPPISAYGQTKLLGEQYVERFCRRHFIVRTAWLYSCLWKKLRQDDGPSGSDPR